MFKCFHFTFLMFDLSDVVHWIQLLTFGMLAHVILNVLSVRPTPIEMKHTDTSSSDGGDRHILSRFLIDDILENQTTLKFKENIW